MNLWNSPRSGRKHKAWGASPRINIEKLILSPRGGRQRCRPLRGLDMVHLWRILGLAPQALFCRLLRRLLTTAAPRAT